MRMSFRYVILLAAGALIALVAIVVSQGSVPPAEALFSDRDGDSVIDVAEVITGSDPNDAHSAPEDTFPDNILGTLLCADGLDNDGDGLTDLADSGCMDGDDDIVSDQTETFLGSDPDSNDSFPEDSRIDAVLQWLGFGFVQTCIDAHDNDADGSIDAADSGCVTAMLHDSDAFDDLTEKLFGSDPSDGNSVPEHEKANPGSCSDGIDNDRDGVMDGAEQACEPLANDTIDTATTIGGALPFEDSVNVNSAGLEPGEPRGDCYFEPQFTLWYTYTAPADGVITADTAGSNFTSALAVYTRSGSRYTAVSCAPAVANRPFDSPGAHATIRVTQGETYYIQAIGYIFPGLPNKLRLVVDTGHPPANDNYAAPHVIASLPFSENLNTADATSEFGEPTGRCVYNQPMASVWYRYTATSDTLLIADTRGTSYTTAITAWTDSQFGLAEVGCSYYEPRVAFPVEAGRTYYVQITSQERSSGGSLHFGLTEGEPPDNDDFVDATNVSSLPFADSVDTFAATRELGEPVPTCAYEFANTVWYKTTAQESGYLKASVEAQNNSPYTIIGVYQGSSPDELTEIACASPYYYLGSVETALAATAGETYYFQIGTPYYGRGEFVPTVEETAEAAGFSTETGMVTFHLETLIVPSCAPSQFTFSDPADDQRGGFGGPPPTEGTNAAPDITSLSGGSDGSNLCVRVEFAEPLPAPSEDPFEYRRPSRIEFDVDENIDTGYYSQLRYDCGATLGADVAGSFNLRGGVLVPLEISYDFSGPGETPEAGGASPSPGFPPPEQHSGFVTFGEQSLQFIVPLAALGGDDHLRLAFAAYANEGFDCVPDNGVAVSPQAPASGDVNCDGAVNSVDSTLILQRFANLLYEPLPCGYAGDVNDNGGVGPIDAVLILQHSAGMITQFTPEG